MIMFDRSAISGPCFAVCLLALCLVSPSFAAPVIENRDQPAHGRYIQQLEEMWRIGGLDDEENLLGLVKNVVADGQGNLYMLDTQLIEVLVYGPDGQYLKSLGREGDGPGELRRPRDVALLPDGTVGLVQGFPGRIIKVDRDGLPAGDLHPGGDPANGGAFALRKVVSAGDRQTEYYQFTYIRELASNHRDEVSRFFPDSWTLSADGRVWIPPFRNDYHIDVYEADGTLLRSIKRQYEPYQRSISKWNRPAPG